MKKAIPPSTAVWRIILAVCLAGMMIGSRIPQAARAGGAGHWTDFPPTLDGVARAEEWAAAYKPAITPYPVEFSVYTQNDDQFFYFLIDVTGETPAAPDPISHSEDFSLEIATVPSGPIDVMYYLSYTGPNPLLRSTPLGGGSWTSGSACLSYGAAGFGPSPFNPTPHRIYEVAVRLSELGLLPAEAFGVQIYVTSTNPAFNRLSAKFTVLAASPVAAFIYNTDQAEAQAYQNLLLQKSGLFAELVPLGQVELIDFSPYRAILIGNDTSSNGSTWLGSDAAAEKIRRSGKPLVGIGYGGTALFGKLGSVLNWGNSALFTGENRVQPTLAVEHSAWRVPVTITVGTSPINLYSTPVNLLELYSLAPDVQGHWKSLTILGNNPNNANYRTIIGQQINGTCYTLWGYLGLASQLTDTGKQLLANLTWQPMCRPSVFYLLGDNGSFSNDMAGLLIHSGFLVTYADASSAATLNFSGYGVILIGWDVPASDWNVVANVLAVNSSQLPVVAMGGGGATFLQALDVPMASVYGWMLSPQKDADLRYPLLPALLRPYPSPVLSSLTNTFDTAGSIAYGMGSWPVAQNETVIGYRNGSTAWRDFSTQPFKGACYLFYGFDSYPANMTQVGKDLLRNMLAQPSCNNPVYLPVQRR